MASGLAQPYPLFQFPLSPISGGLGPLALECTIPCGELPMTHHSVRGEISVSATPSIFTNILVTWSASENIHKFIFENLPAQVMGHLSPFRLSKARLPKPMIVASRLSIVTRFPNPHVLP